MRVTIGTQLGSLEITELLGKGGMGEVYRARDTKLKREVAIKILPHEFARDPDRLSRFQREAEVLASLNHPNIAGIHSLEEANGSRFLVLELVEGETLAERIRRGALPIDEALQIARDICEALEAAHERGVIHRDLKPANVKVTPEGKVKVLDFGLAKALDNTPAVGNLSQSPTLSFGATRAGVILGTAAYMSPEQAKGINTDQRSDIFSFGAVLYEMLTGRQAFQGDSVSEVLASILAREPDLGLMPPNLNPRIRALVRRALEKNPKRRWHAIGDLRVEMETVLADLRGELVEEQRVAAPKPLWKRAIPVFVPVVLTAAIISAGMWYFRPSPAMPITRLSFTPAEGQENTARGRTSIAISRDGTQMVYIANQRLYLKTMSQLEARPILGTEGVSGANTTSPAFSPDGQFLVFYSGTDQTLKKIAVSGGAAETLCHADNPFGISWGEDGIVFGQGNKGIMRVFESGGEPKLLVSVKAGELAHGPQVLPGGGAVLYTLATGEGEDRWDTAKIVVQELKPGSEPKVIFPGGSDARYVPTGHIVYALGGTLFAVPFDLEQMKTTSGPLPVVKGVLRAEYNTGAAHFSFSNTGTLIYIPGPVVETGGETLATMGRSGGIERLKLTSKNYGYPRVSPDGTRVAFTIGYVKESNVWIYDLAGTSSPKQITSGSANRYPIWIDNDRVAFQSDREDGLGIWSQRSDQKGTAERLTVPDQGVVHIPDSWSKACNCFSYTAVKGSEGKVWIYSLQDRKPKVFIENVGSFIGRSAFSPDGQWMAYQSNELGANQIFVQPYPSKDAKHPILGGGNPFWSPSGEELFWTSGPNRTSVVRIKKEPIFSYEELPPVPDGLSTRNPTLLPRFSDIINTNGRFIGVPITPISPQIEFVLNWFEELRQPTSAH